MTIARWSAAAIAILYGFAKLNGSQFTILDSELDKPMGSVSGFWLTWYWFGYSKVYGSVIALTQIGGGLLLTTRRWALIGALVLLPVAVNIVLIDVLFGVDPGGTIAGLVFLGLLVRIVAPSVPELLRFLERPAEPARRTRGILGAAALVLIAFGFTWWVANRNNRAPTTIDGVWEVRSATPRTALARAFFERNRAHLVVLKDSAGAYRRHHFEVDADTVRIWTWWLRKGTPLWIGTVDAAARRIDLRSVAAGDSTRLVLER